MSVIHTVIWIASDDTGLVHYSDTHCIELKIYLPILCFDLILFNCFVKHLLEFQIKLTIEGHWYCFVVHAREVNQPDMYANPSNF